MADDRDHDTHEPAEPESSHEEIDEGLEVAGEVVERVGQVAEIATDLADGEVATPTATGTLGGVAEALGGVDQIASLANADPGVRQVLAVAQQAATLAARGYEAGEALVEAAESVIEAITGEADQHRVEYEFECTAEESVGWRVREVEIEEELGAPYHVRLSLITDDLDALPTNLLGVDCTLHIRRGDDTSRSVHGIVSRVDHGQRSERHLVTSIEVVPALEVLRHIEDSRIFQNLTALEIIDAYLGQYLDGYSRTLRIEANATYVQREYCVQYRETALAFFHRLCEEEGLTYFFDHSGDKEELVIVDDNASFAPAYLMPTAADVPFVAHRGGDIARAEPAYSFAASDRLGPTSLTLADFDWTANTLPFSEEQRSRDTADRDREQYDHDSTATIGHYDAGQKKYTRHDLASRVQRGRERQHLSTFEYRGSGVVTGFTVGNVFTLSGHPDAGLDGEYLLISIRHRGRDTHAGDAAQVGEDESTLEYENEFVCIPSSVPYRPALRTPKPRITGVQTSLVVGPANEEIWTDEHGRIRVQFHWDREGRRDEASTCWVRVMQSWAGAGFGAMFIPRIGMEVVVSFVDGDPDRPLVTGCVYNGNNPPPIQVPEDKTQTVLRTQSSPGGDGFNELRFEDKAGEERVFVHAQKDYDEVVEHDHSTRVKRNQSNTVDADQTERVGGDQSMTVRGNRDVLVEKNETIKVMEFQTVHIEGNHDETVVHDQMLTVQGKRDVFVGLKDTETFDGGRETTVNYFDNTTVNANKNTHVTGQHNTKADEHFHVEQGAQMVHLGNSRVHIESDGAITLTRPGATVYLAADGIQLTTEGSLILRGGGCELTMHEGRVVITAVDEAKMRAGDGVVKVAPQYAEMAAPSVSIDAQQIASVQAGTLVRIN